MSLISRVSYLLLLIAEIIGIYYIFNAYGFLIALVAFVILSHIHNSHNARTRTDMEYRLDYAKVLDKLQNNGWKHDDEVYEGLLLPCYRYFVGREIVFSKGDRKMIMSYESFREAL